VAKKLDLIMSSTITTTTTINNDYEPQVETTENPDWVRLMIEKYNAGDHGEANQL
jgi:hypothetical protein